MEIQAMTSQMFGQGSSSVNGDVHHFDIIVVMETWWQVVLNTITQQDF
jgi:acid stress-induced BolA-like protein IbaG/YrbA